MLLIIIILIFISQYDIDLKNIKMINFFVNLIIYSVKT